MQLCCESRQLQLILSRWQNSLEHEINYVSHNGKHITVIVDRYGSR